METFNYQLSSQTILDHYQAMLAPGGISVSVEDNFVRTSPVELAIEVPGGATAQMAILPVNSEDLESAVWGPYCPTALVSIGPSDGEYKITVGLRGLADPTQSTWETVTITLDTAAPVVGGLTPASGSTVNGLSVNLLASANEELVSVEVERLQDGEVVTTWPGAIREKYYDPVLERYTTTSFASYWLELEEGANELRLRVRDMAGNETVVPVQYQVDLAGDTVAPAFQVAWPANQAMLSGNTYAVRGTVDDLGARVKASVTAGANAAEVWGMVGTDGSYWIEDVPLYSGANTVVVSALDDAGNVSQQTLQVSSSALSLVINPPTIDVATPVVDVTGTVADPTYTVTVNGVDAIVSPDGSWMAQGVPYTLGAVVCLTAQAVKLDQPVVQAAIAASADPQVVLMEYRMDYKSVYTRNSDGYQWVRTKHVNWKKATGGTAIDEESESPALPGSSRPCKTEWQWGAFGTIPRVRHFSNGTQEDWHESTNPDDYPQLWLETGKMKKTAIDADWTVEWNMKKVNSIQRLFVGRRSNTNKKMAALKLLPYAAAYDRGVDNNWVLEHGCHPPDHKLGHPGHFYEGEWTPSAEPVAREELKLDGKEPDCNGVVFKLYRNGKELDVTVKAEERKWLAWSVGCERPPLYRMTRSVHPKAPDKRLQSRFDKASLLYGVDDDEKICSGPRSGASDDDVPYYAELYISNDNNPAPWPPAYEAEQYNKIYGSTDAETILKLPHASIKQVTEMRDASGSSYPGKAVKLSLLDPRILVSISGAKEPMVLAHEWGHTRGLIAGLISCLAGNPCFL